MRKKVMFDYGQKKFVNLEAEDDIADKYEKKYPDYVHEPALLIAVLIDSDLKDKA